MLGATVNEINWVLRNWFEFGILLAQCVLLGMVMWYGSKILKFLQVFFQYQNEFRERLSASIDAIPEEVVRIDIVWRDVKRWLQAPMGSGGVDPLRTIVKWLQAR
jgi:hypothetical protein